MRELDVWLPDTIRYPLFPQHKIPLYVDGKLSMSLQTVDWWPDPRLSLTSSHTVGTAYGVVRPPWSPVQ